MVCWVYLQLPINKLYVDGDKIMCLLKVIEKWGLDILLCYVDITWVSVCFIFDKNLFMFHLILHITFQFLKKVSFLSLFHIPLGCIDFLLTEHVVAYPLMFSLFKLTSYLVIISMVEELWIKKSYICCPCGLSVRNNFHFIVFVVVNR